MAPRGKPKGLPKTGGRTKGTLNKRTDDVVQKLARLGCDPIEGMAKIAMGDVKCFTCKGKKELPNPESKGKSKKMVVCFNCLGDGMEPIPVDLRATMFAKLAPFVAPTLKSVEVTADIGDTLPAEELDDETLTALAVSGVKALKSKKGKPNGGTPIRPN